MCVSQNNYSRRAHTFKVSKVLYQKVKNKTQKQTTSVEL